MKKWKRLLALMLALCLCISMMACGEQEETSPKTDETQEKEPEGSSPLLYKVTDKAGNEVWLFGSIHVGEDSFYPLPDYVMDAYDASESLSVECDIVAFEKDMTAQMNALQPLIYVDGTKIKDHISPELYEKAVKILEECNLYSEFLDYYYPILWSNFISSAMTEKVGADSSQGIDMYLLRKAKNDEKPVVEVESAAFQYGMMAKFSEPLQIIQLESVVEEYGDLQTYEKELKNLMDLWTTGDEKALAKLLAKETEFTDDTEKALYEEYYNAMYTSRNLAMADFVEGKLEAGEKTFVCVGAAHIVGAGAMVELLTQRGYTVELVK